MKCIFACTQDGIIGVNGKIPWDIKDDLKFFKEQTTDNVVIMGRKTYESIGKPLPNRDNIVISSRNIDGVKTVSSLNEALNIADKNKTIFCIGGAKLLNEAIPKSDEIIVSYIDEDVKYNDSDEVTRVNMSFIEFMSLKTVEPHNGFTVFIFN